LWAQSFQHQFNTVKSECKCKSMVMNIRVLWMYSGRSIKHMDYWVSTMALLLPSSEKSFRRDYTTFPMNGLSEDLKLKAKYN
jgi:hypothetical protein